LALDPAQAALPPHEQFALLCQSDERPSIPSTERRPMIYYGAVGRPQLTGGLAHRVSTIVAALLFVLASGCTSQIEGHPAPQSKADQERAYRAAIRSISPALDDERAVERGRATCEDLQMGRTRGLLLGSVILRHFEAYPMNVPEAQELIRITRRMLC
jgi:hypothetical protein